MNEYELEI
jgi:hypothetical protein